MSADLCDIGRGHRGCMGKQGPALLWDMKETWDIWTSGLMDSSSQGLVTAASGLNGLWSGVGEF